MNIRLYHYMSLYSLLLALAAVSCSAVKKGEVSKFVPEIKTYVCKKAQGKIIIDGNLNELSWANAIPVDRFYEIIPRPVKHVPYNNIRSYFLYDKKFLYIGARIEDNDIVADPKHLNKAKETPFLNGDTFEVFIQPDKDKPTYYEFHVNPLNVVWDARFVARTYMWFFDYAQWDSDMTTAVKMEGTLNKIDNDKGWTVEISIPLTCFTDKDGIIFKIEKGDKWRFSVCMYDYSYYYDNGGDHDSRKFISSSKLEYLDFHLRQNFDFLQFE